MCDDVPYHGWRGVTVHALPPCQAGMGVIGVHGVGAHRCTGSRCGPYTSLPCRVVRRDLVGQSASQGCSVGLGRSVCLEELFDRNWSVGLPHRVAQRDLVGLVGLPRVMGLLWVPRFLGIRTMHRCSFYISYK